MTYNSAPFSTVADVPPAVASHLRRFDQQARRRAFWRSAGVAVLLLICWAAMCCAIDRVAKMSSLARFTLLVAGVSLTVILLLRALWNTRRLANWVDIAGQIESVDPQFQQSLLTVVSQFAGDRSARGSEQILSRVQHDVELRLAAAPARATSSAAGAISPWVGSVILLLAAGFLFRQPRLGAAQLAERFMLPYAGIPPVTTTQIAVSPGNHDFDQLQPLQIDAVVQHLSGDSVFLNLNTQGDWYRTVMNTKDGVHFSYALTSMDRDVKYYVAAGDAQSPNYLARVLRRPTVLQFQISYEFPDYVRRAPVTVTNTNGLIEAPIGSQATLTVICSEELQSALLTVGDDKILMSRTGNGTSRQATFRVTKDARYSLDLISARDVPGSGPGEMRIRALPNQPPIARLFQSGQELRLTPRDRVSVSYQAADDYALTGLALRARINNAEAVEIPIRILGNQRWQRGGMRLDLANFRLKIGDVATVAVVARDSAGQATVSDPMRIFISTQPVDLDMRERVTEMESASNFATKLIADLNAAREAVGRADGNPDKRSNTYAAASAQANLSLANASESATLLRQCLCRAILHTRSGAHCVALSNWSDTAQTVAQMADDLFKLRGDSAGTAQSLDPQFQRSLEQAHHLADEVATAWQAQLAEVALAEREDLIAMKQDPSNATTNASLQRLKLDPKAADVKDRLKGLIDAGKALAGSAHPIDYASAVRSWADELSRGAHSNPGVDRRLSAAAEAEAVRPDADLQRARDLQLASRAAAAIGASLSEKQPEESAAAANVNAFAGALAALQHEYELRHQQPNPPSADELKSASATAAAARGQLLSWAPDANTAGPEMAAGNHPVPDTSPSAPKRDAEDLALQASAASAAHDYERAAHLDAVLEARLRESAPVPGGVARDPDDQLDVVHEGVAESMAAARRIDGIGRTLDAVVAQTRDGNHAAANDLATRERGIANEIGEVVTQTENSSVPNSRERAAAAFLALQEQLAAVPQALADAQAAAAASRNAASRVTDAKAAESRRQPQASGEERGMAHRAAIEAANEATEASDRLHAAMGAINPARAAAWADELGAYAPESTPACNAIQTQLVASLADLDRALHASDPQSIDHAAGNVRSAVESVQRELADAQDALTQRDPLVAAKSFATAAADSLAQSPPDVNGAIKRQVRATGALARAWDQSIHDAASQRLSVVPSLQPVFGPAAPGSAVSRAGGSAGSDWSHAPAHHADSLNFMGHDSDPTGYEEALRIYFQALGKAQADHGEGH